jgi:hypothetical protein
MRGGRWPVPRQPDCTFVAVTLNRAYTGSWDANVSFADLYALTTPRARYCTFVNAFLGFAFVGHRLKSGGPHRLSARQMYKVWRLHHISKQLFFCI